MEYDYWYLSTVIGCWILYWLDSLDSFSTGCCSNLLLFFWTNYLRSVDGGYSSFVYIEYSNWGKLKYRHQVRQIFKKFLISTLLKTLIQFILVTFTFQNLSCGCRLTNVYKQSFRFLLTLIKFMRYGQLLSIRKNSTSQLSRC